MSKIGYAFLWLVGIVGIIWAASSSSAPKTSVKLFCTYNRVFIEFEQGSATWGTIMLDDTGVPIPCGEEEIKTKLELIRT